MHTVVTIVQVPLKQLEQMLLTSHKDVNDFTLEFGDSPPTSYIDAEGALYVSISRHG